ncbi:hypothetical protein [Jatrophihabitans sp.]|uniref:hypothetical protein n=1 Tax=Jatrophihabitans sp. TaxID=1932789 RepID=UPI002BA01014|nr:hypothetical protein [Jatrophihabitans sp.]
MPSGPAVEIQLASIEKAWKRYGGADMWLQLRTGDGTLEDFASAAAELNDEAEADGVESVWAEAPSSAPAGFVVLLTHCADREELRRWISEFAGRLERRGLSGKLQPTPPVRYPDWLSGAQPPVPTAFLAWSVDRAAEAADPYRSSHWHVPAEATYRIAALADRWARLPGAELRLRYNVYRAAVNLDDASGPLARSLFETGMAGLEFVDDAGQQATNVAFDVGGTSLFQDIGGTGGWQAQVDRLRAALTALPAEVDLGFIRMGIRASVGIDSMATVQPLPGIEEYHVRYNTHLLDRYLPDAHGIQVLRTAHLDRARDLSGWEVTELGEGRFLVQAADLTPWYGAAQPDPDVLARARADFASALLTEEVISANPPPWRAG